MPLKHLTLGIFWTTVARQGGYLSRAIDLPSGWQVLWTGWRQIQTLVEEARLGRHTSPGEHVGKKIIVSPLRMGSRHPYPTRQH